MLHSGVGSDLCKEAMTMCTDNQLLMDLGQFGAVNHRTQHIDVSYNFCRQALLCKKIKEDYCRIEGMVTSLLTKPFGRAKQEQFIKSVGLVRFSQ